MGKEGGTLWESGEGEGIYIYKGFFFISKKVNLYNFLLASLATSSKFAVNLSYILEHVYLTH